MYARCFLWRQNNPEVHYSPNSDLLGSGVFLGEIASIRHYSKKDYNEKKKEQHSYKIGTWNVRTLNRGGKLENLKKGNATELWRVRFGRGFGLVIRQTTK